MNQDTSRKIITTLAIFTPTLSTEMALAVVNNIEELPCYIIKNMKPQSYKQLSVAYAT